MTVPVASGAELICEALHRAGVECVFGLPGTQNVDLFEALRNSPLRTVVAVHELSAAMMANGYYRASGRPGVLVTIPGPGFTWALSGLAEASLDSTALLHIVGQPARSPGERFQLQALDQAAMACPIVKAVHQVDRAEDVAAVLGAAHAQSLSGEPGPVLIQTARAMLAQRAGAAVAATQPGNTACAADLSVVDEVVRALVTAKRCVIFAGQGANDASDLIVRLVEGASAAVVTTTSGRGVVPEDHPLSLGFELGGNGTQTLNALIEASDLVLAIGCKFSHNGSRGFQLRIPAEKLIHVDASADVLGANYPARHTLCMDARAFAAAVLDKLVGRGRPAGFSADEIARFRERGREEGAGDLVEPKIHGVRSGKPEEFFAALRRAMPRSSCLVTDSGLHQVLVRRYFRVLHPRGLMTPTNLQSMGFGIGAAIGACLADPSRPVVALIGDGGLALSGLELLTAVRERVGLTVIVFVDGAYGMIRVQQLAAFGHTHGTEFSGPDIAALAAAVGAAHVRLEGDPETVLRTAIESGRVTLVEVGVGDTLPMQWMRAKGVARHWLFWLARFGARSRR
ncbi:thiamine pyrophosphate-binding protein [Dokdonella soli]|uniref:Thiamine pyrophosphate-binding protein n=1 Tax=Dokdonella soli TaxID=529810 RepID=A0ABN1INS8_9GAMM